MPRVLLGVSHTKTVPSWAPRTQELEKCAENLGATRGTGRGHSPPPALSQTTSQWRASSVIPSLTWGGKWAGPVCWEGPASPYVPAQNGVPLPCSWKWTEEAGKVPFIPPHRLPLGCKSSNWGVKKGRGYPGNYTLENLRIPKPLPALLSTYSSKWSMEEPSPSSGSSEGCRWRGQATGLGQPGPGEGHSTGITSSFVCKPPAGPAPRRTGRKCQTPWCPSPARQPGTTPCFRFQSCTQLYPLPPQPRPQAPPTA